MATHAINKANSRLRFLYRQNKFLDIPLGRRHWEYWRLQPREKFHKTISKTDIIYIMPPSKIPNVECGSY